MLVIESGGTKSTWVFGNSPQNRVAVETVGLHPREISEEKINIIQGLITENSLENKETYFFGAGCEHTEAQETMRHFLEQMKLCPIVINSDIHAACLAHLWKNPGVVGILGTGAAAAEFDGTKITKRTSGLGYLIGDEGSGFDIGKKLLQAYFEKKLTNEIEKEIENYFEGKSIVHRIYAPDGRFVIAGLTKIAMQFREKKQIQEILNAAFAGFCQKALNPLSFNTPVHFVGSIAFFFKEELRKTLKTAGYQLGNIEKEAVYKLFDVLSENKKGIYY